MNRWMMLLIIALIAPAFFLTGCTITGQTSGMLSDDIIECSMNTRIGFITINDKVQACYRGSGLYFVVENKGSDVISGLSVNLDSDYDVAMMIRERAGPGETVQQSLSFGSYALDSAKSLTIYPFIGSGDNKMLCERAGITAVLEEC